MFVIVDVETTGFKTNYICQLSYIVMNERFEVREAKNSFYRVPVMEPGASKVHGFTLDFLNDKSDVFFSQTDIGELRDLFENNILVGHNIDFDRKMIESNAIKSGTPINIKQTKCTLSYTRKRYAQLPNKKLESLIRVSNIDMDEATKICKFLFNTEDTPNLHDARMDVTTLLMVCKTDPELQKFLLKN